MTFKRRYIDTETCGLHGMPVLLQWAEDDGPITLQELWKEPIRKTLKTIEWLCEEAVIGFNLSFDMFALCKTYTIFRLANPDWIPEEHINELALLEPRAQDGPCIKPVSALDLMLYARKGPLQSLMARDDIRIRRVPTALAYALAEELEKRIVIDKIYFAKSADADAPRWQVFDRKDRFGDLDANFKDVCLRFSPAGGLKFLAEHVLGLKPKFHYHDVEPPTAWRPFELGYAPTALAIMDKISYAVYSGPPLASVFATGEIKNTNMVCDIDYPAIEQWIKERLEDFDGEYHDLTHGATFLDELRFLNENLDNGPGSRCFLHQQTKLIDIPEEAAQQVEDFLQKVLDLGGEGVVVRNPNALWTPRRHKGLLKYKPFEDAEARVIGFTSGRETDKGSRHLGRIGALITDFNGKRLELSGMKDYEREFASGEMGVFAAANPGVDMPDWFQGRHFKKGQTVTFKYRELTNDGIPKEARFWRRRDVE